MRQWLADQVEVYQRPKGKYGHCCMCGNAADKIIQQTKTPLCSRSCLVAFKKERKEKKLRRGGNSSRTTNDTTTNAKPAISADAEPDYSKPGKYGWCCICFKPANKMVHETQDPLCSRPCLLVYKRKFAGDKTETQTRRDSEGSRGTNGRDTARTTSSSSSSLGGNVGGGMVSSRSQKNGTRDSNSTSSNSSHTNGNSNSNDGLTGGGDHVIARADMDPFHAWSDPVTENSNNSTSGIGAGAGHGDTGSQLTEKNIPSHRTEGHSRTDSKDKNNKTRAHTNTQTNTSRSNTSHVHTNSQNPLQRTYVSKENTGSDRRYDGSNERTVNTASVTVSATGGCAVKNTGINESSETHSKGTRRHSRSNRKVAGDGYGVHEKSRYGRCKIPRTSPAKLTAQRVSSSVNDRHDHSAFASSFTSTSFSKGAHSSPIRPSSSSSAATAAAAATEPKTFHPRWAQLANKSKMDPSSSSMPSSQSSSSSSSSSSSMSTPIHPIRSVIMLPGQSHQQHYQHRINISSESSHTNEQNMDDGDTASRKTTQHRARLDALIIQFVYLFFQSSLSQLSTLILWLVAVTVGLCLQGLQMLRPLGMQCLQKLKQKKHAPKLTTFLYVGCAVITLMYIMLTYLMYSDTGSGGFSLNVGLPLGKRGYSNNHVFSGKSIESVAVAIQGGDKIDVPVFNVGDGVDVDNGRRMGKNHLGVYGESDSNSNTESRNNDNAMKNGIGTGGIGLHDGKDSSAEDDQPSAVQIALAQFTQHTDEHGSAAKGGQANGHHDIDGDDPSQSSTSTSTSIFPDLISSERAFERSVLDRIKTLSAENSDGGVGESVGASKVLLVSSHPLLSYRLAPMFPSWLNSESTSSSPPSSSSSSSQWTYIDEHRLSQYTHICITSLTSSSVSTSIMRNYASIDAAAVAACILSSLKTISPSSSSQLFLSPLEEAIRSNNNNLDGDSGGDSEIRQQKQAQYEQLKLAIVRALLANGDSKIVFYLPCMSWILHHFRDSDNTRSDSSGHAGENLFIVYITATNTDIIGLSERRLHRQLQDKSSSLSPSPSLSPSSAPSRTGADSEDKETSANTMGDRDRELTTDTVDDGALTIQEQEKRMFDEKSKSLQLSLLQKLRSSLDMRGSEEGIDFSDVNDISTLSTPSADGSSSDISSSSSYASSSPSSVSPFLLDYGVCRQSQLSIGRWLKRDGLDTHIPPLPPSSSPPSSSSSAFISSASREGETSKSQTFSAQPAQAQAQAQGQTQAQTVPLKASSLSIMDPFSSLTSRPTSLLSPVEQRALDSLTRWSSQVDRTMEVARIRNELWKAQQTLMHTGARSSSKGKNDSGRSGPSKHATVSYQSVMGFVNSLYYNKYAEPSGLASLANTNKR